MDGTGRRGHVLVVDDEPGVRTTISEALAYEGYEVSEASNGTDALAAIERKAPDAIVLDLWMPVMDGWQFRAAQLARFPGIAVIVLSAMEPSSARLAELRADAIIGKPFELDNLYDAVAMVLRDTSGPDAPGAGRARA